MDEKTKHSLGQMDMNSNVKISLIACKHSQTNAIGYKNRLLYQLPKELQHFHAITIGNAFMRGGSRNVVVMGYNTFKSLHMKPLKHRVNIVVTKEHYNECISLENEDLYILTDLKFLLPLLRDIAPSILDEVFIIGGQKLYESALREKICDRMILTDIECGADLDTDTFDTIFPMHLANHFEIQEESVLLSEDDILFLPTGEKIPRVFYRIREYTRNCTVNKEESAYLALLKEALNSPLRTTRNASTYAIFGKRLTFDLSKGFPFLTTKRMPIQSKTIEKELLFFLRGETDNDILQKQGVHIWDSNTNEEFLKSSVKDLKVNDMGPMYGHQFRHFGAEYRGCHADYGSEGIDQLQQLIKNIREDPSSRRHMMTSLNMAQVEEGCLWPCHSIVIQCYVRGEYLDMMMYQRSADLFLGLPFNIASNAILLGILAALTSYKAGILTIVIGDAHVYEQHVEQVRLQLKRKPFPFPQYHIKSHSKISDYTLDDLNLVPSTYMYYPRIKANMVA